MCARCGASARTEWMSQVCPQVASHTWEWNVSTEALLLLHLLLRGSWASFLAPPEFQFGFFVCRKDGWELTSLGVRSTSHMHCTGVFGLIALGVRLVMGRNECTRTKGLPGLACTALSSTLLWLWRAEENITHGRDPIFCTSSAFQNTGVSNHSNCEIPAVAVTYKFCLCRMKKEIHGQNFEAPWEIDKGSRAAYPWGLFQYAQGKWGESRNENTNVHV